MTFAPLPKGTTKFTLGALALLAALAVATAATARPVPRSFADLVEQVAPAVVTISTLQKGAAETSEPGGKGFDLPVPPDSPLRDFFERHFDEDGLGRAPRLGGPQRQVNGVGSGFILDPEGYVVTNNHVVAGAEEVKVTLKDGRSYPAELVGRDEKTDLALLKIEAGEPLPAVAFGDSEGVRVGDWVMAVGNPFGLGGTVTAGIVSARGRDLAGGTLIDFLQIDAAINRGNSGGPAFNGEGQVIGINTAIFSPNGGSVGIGFAIPSNLARQVIAELREKGQVERGWLGVRIQPVTPELAEGLGLEEPHGALIASVEPGGPADRAGLRAGDVITAWDGKTVERFKDLPRLVALTPAGRETEVTLWRDETETTHSVVTGTMPQDDRIAARDPAPRAPDSGTIVPGTGLKLATLTPELRERFGIRGDIEGVVVLAVADYSAAADQGIRPGDVIGSIALEPVATATEAAARVEALRADGQAVVMLMVQRGGNESFFALRLADA